MNAPQVSVIISVDNAMTYLPISVNSVLRQTFSDFEVLIINDGSLERFEKWFSGLSDRRI